MFPRSEVTVKGSVRLQRATKRYRSAQAAVDEARVELHAAIEQARAEGMTLDAIGGVLGVTRQRVLRMLRGD
jgi:hypothetical protein